MMPLLKDVKVLIWDFDGTFYQPNADLFHEVRESEYRTIMECNHWDRDHAIAEFQKYHKKITPSATQTVAHLCHMTTNEAAQIMESYFDRRDYVSRDEKLIALFQQLKQYTQYILANGTAKRLKETLEKLGVPLETFEEVVTSEISGENKPNDNGYRYILNKTKLPPAAHLMIGDRETVDLVTAKKLGMHTCLVWSDTKSILADVTLQTVYQVADVLT